VLLRFLLLLVLAGVFCSNDGFALFEEEDKENNPPVQNQFSTPIAKRKRNTDLKNQENLDTPKRQKTDKEEKISVFSPLIKFTPTTAELRFLSPIRGKFLRQLNNNEAIDYSRIRANYEEAAHPGYYSRKIVFEGETVLQGDFLFDPYTDVLNGKGKWKSNLERMKTGLAPVGHKGIVKKDELTSLTKKEVLSRQRAYTIDIHHVTQNDTKSPKDPFCEMTHAAHMGHNARSVSEKDPETEQVTIIGKSLTKAEALELIQDNSNRTMYCNFFHPLKGPSEINRTYFDNWRKKYWKKRAKEIEDGDGDFISHPPLFVCKVLFFDSEEDNSSTTSPTSAVSD
jgi:hypothetical protein